MHAPGQADLNLYAYVSGRLFAATDPAGLDEIGVGEPTWKGREDAKAAIAAGFWNAVVGVFAGAEHGIRNIEGQDEWARQYSDANESEAGREFRETYAPLFLKPPEGHEAGALWATKMTILGSFAPLFRGTGGVLLAEAEGPAAELAAVGQEAKAAAPGARGGVEPVRVGQQGEVVSSEYMQLPKNNDRIPSASGRSEFGIPDFKHPGGHHLGESKNVAYQHLSRQIKDDMAYVLRDHQPGLVEVLIDKRTDVSLPLLREHLNPGSPIKLKTLPLGDKF